MSKTRWGWDANSEMKPAFLTTEDKANCYATNSGWTQATLRGPEEVLVSIKNLATKLEGPNLLTLSVADRASNDAPVIVTGNYNMKVDFYGDHHIEISNVYLTGNGECQVISGNNTSEIKYKYTPETGDDVANSDPWAVFAENISGTVVANSNVSAVLSSSNIAAAGYDCATDIRPSLEEVYIIET